jgi:hypothetical protein
MNPIFTVSNDKNINGYWYNDFGQRFSEICQEHLANCRAKTFAFIVYNFHSPTHITLENNGVFNELDRLSGRDITIFYLDGYPGRERNFQNTLYSNFNRILIEQTNQMINSVPFITFFDFEDGNVTNFKYYRIRDDEKFVLHDLSKAINEKLALLKTKKNSDTPLQLQSITKDVLRDTPKIMYGEFLGILMQGIIEQPSNG